MNRNPIIRMQDVTFTYAGMQVPALSDVSLEVAPGTLCLLVGPSGSGKTTLLRLLKKALAPVGELSGTIETPEAVAFVMQDPTHQIVMDVVWHELAFGLENMGLPPAVIERRIAETAHFFGIEDWIHRPVSELSGGEKQILNVASSLILQPKMLILDEPTAQLDPIAVQHFLALISRIRRELGTTILLSEHHLTDALPMADDVVWLNEGRVAFHGSAKMFAVHALDERAPFSKALPAATRAAARIDPEAMALTIPEARAVLEASPLISSTEATVPSAVDAAPTPDVVLSAKHVYFRYRGDLPWVIEDVSFDVGRGEVHALVGGNGSGKSTLMHVLSGAVSPTRGRVRRSDDVRVGLLTQHARAVFSMDTVRDDWMELRALGHYGEADVDRMALRLGLTRLMDRHPYDLSAGETQKAALGKLLLLDPDILLLDEPVKGVDADAKADVAHLLRCLADDGKAVLIVTHDVGFSAQIADRCSMLFDGRIVATEDAHTFYLGNAFYTTDWVRITQAILPDIVTEADFDRWFVSAEADRA